MNCEAGRIPAPRSNSLAGCRHLQSTWETSMNRIKLLVAAAFLAAITVSAQDWAKARLENSPRHREWVKLKHGGREVNSYIAYPEVKEKAPAVVVIHAIFGLTDWVRGITDDLAEAGYIA